jgi:hypothetical protein
VSLRSVLRGSVSSVYPIGGGGGGFVPADFITNVDATGWQATFNGTAPALTALELLPGYGNLTAEGGGTTRPITVTRNGFNDAGGATTFSDTIYATQRKRLPSQYFPVVNANDAGPFTFTSTTVMLSERVFSGETVAGATNSSAAVSPKPLGQWTSRDRSVITDSVTVSAVFAHWAARNGRQVRCVEFFATDGVLTVQSGKILNPVLSSFTGDFRNYPHWQATLDTSTLAAGLITVYAIAHPWVGSAASVLDSRDNTYNAANFNLFTNQYYRKDAAATVYAFVQATASGTEAPNTDINIARGNYYGSIATAILALQTFNGGRLDGCCLVIGGLGVVFNQSNTARVQNIAGLRVIRDPNLARAAATLAITGTMSVGSVADLPAPLFSSVLTFEDLDMFYTSSHGMLSTYRVEMRYQNCNIDLTTGGYTGGTFWLPNAGQFNIVDFAGCTITAPGQSALRIANSVNVIGMKFRGTRVIYTGSITSSGISISGQFIGSRIEPQTGLLAQTSNVPAVVQFNQGMLDGTVIWHSDVIKSNWATFLGNSGFAAPTGLALVNFMIEACGDGTSGASWFNQGIKLSGDGQTGNMNNVIIHNCSFIGLDQQGSTNSFYDDTDNTTTSTFSASGGTVGVPAAGQQVLTITVAASSLPTVGQVIGVRQAIAGMTSDLTFVSGTGTIVGSTWVVSGATTTFTNRALSVGTVPDARPRTHSYLSIKGSIMPRSANKGDQFNSWVGGPGTNNMSIAQASARQGNWEWSNGVGLADNVFTWLSNFYRDYNGINSAVPNRFSTPSTAAASTETFVATVPQNYTNWQATIGNGTNFSSYVAGAGGGNYTVLAGHPAKNRCGANLYTSHDLNAVVRVANTANSAGAYV